MQFRTILIVRWPRLGFDGHCAAAQAGDVKRLQRSRRSSVRRRSCSPRPTSADAPAAVADQKHRRPSSTARRASRPAAAAVSSRAETASDDLVSRGDLRRCGSRNFTIANRRECGPVKRVRRIHVVHQFPL